MERFKLKIHYRPLNVLLYPHTVEIHCVAGTTIQQAVALAKSYEKDVSANRRSGYRLEGVTVTSIVVPDGE